MIVNRVYMKDVRLWEENNNTNILSLFKDISIENIITLLQIFNHIDEDDACNLLDIYLESISLNDIFNQIYNAFIGYNCTEINDSSNDDDNVDNIDITQYNYMYEYYETLCMQLMALGLSFSEFWNLSTKEAYSTSKALQQKMIIEWNLQSQLQYQEACLTASAFFGKLPKEVPQINLNKDKQDEAVINTKYGEMTYRDYKSLIALEKLGGGTYE